MRVIEAERRMVRALEAIKARTGIEVLSWSDPDELEQLARRVEQDVDFELGVDLLAAISCYREALGEEDRLDALLAAEWQRRR